MRLIGVASIVFTLALAFASGPGPALTAQQIGDQSRDNEDRSHNSGQAIFRYDTFGDEQFWTDVLRMHEVIATVAPATAMGVGPQGRCRGPATKDRRRAPCGRG
jgi:hypothetical protein